MKIVLNDSQRVIVGIGAVVLAISLLWVPFTAHKSRPRDTYGREAGYGFVFAPPQQDGCRVAFGERYSQAFLDRFCVVKVDTGRLVMMSTAIVVATVALLVLTGVSGRRSGAAGANQS